MNFINILKRAGVVICVLVCFVLTVLTITMMRKVEKKEKKEVIYKFEISYLKMKKEAK